MMTLFVFAILIGALSLFRRRLRPSGLDWRSLAGFCVGALLGVLMGRAMAREGGEIVGATGIPWFFFRVFFVLVLGVAAAGPVRGLLEEAFPRNRDRGRNGDVSRRR
jgi:uncharacterized membrane protein YfcA